MGMYKPEVFESEFRIVVSAIDVISSSDIGDHILAGCTALNSQAKRRMKEG